MGDDITELKVAFAKAQERIASMEYELRQKSQAAPLPFTPEFQRRLFLDPVGTMKAMKASQEVLDTARAAFIADTLGESAPPQIRFAAAQGPQVLAAQAQQEQLANLSRQVEEMKNAALNGSKRTSFKAITEIKDKYPNLSKAFSIDEAAILAELEKHGGSAEDFAAEQEKKWAKYGLVPVVQTPVNAATGSVDNPDNKDQSKKVESVQLPADKQQPVPKEEKAGGWSAERHQEIRDRIVQKVSAPKK